MKIWKRRTLNELGGRIYGAVDELELYEEQEQEVSGLGFVSVQYDKKKGNHLLIFKEVLTNNFLDFVKLMQSLFDKD